MTLLCSNGSEVVLHVARDYICTPGRAPPRSAICLWTQLPTRPHADRDSRKFAARAMIFNALDALEYTAPKQNARVVELLSLRLLARSRPRADRIPCPIPAQTRPEGFLDELFIGDTLGAICALEASNEPSRMADAEPNIARGHPDLGDFCTPRCV